MWPYQLFHGCMTKRDLSTDHVARTEDTIEYEDVDDESLMYVGPSKY